MEQVFQTNSRRDLAVEDNPNTQHFRSDGCTDSAHTQFPDRPSGSGAERSDTRRHQRLLHLLRTQPFPDLLSHPHLPRGPYLRLLQYQQHPP